jgi:hypothetical protein
MLLLGSKQSATHTRLFMDMFEVAQREVTRRRIVVREYSCARI